MVNDEGFGLFDRDLGSSMPGVPHAGGLHMTQSEAVMEAMQRSTGYGLSRYMLMHDQRTQYASAMAAQSISGAGARGWLQTDAGKAVQELLGTAINSRMVGGMGGGGNILNFGVGIQNALASGVGVQMGAGGVLQNVQGRGYLNDQMTYALFNSLQQHFYNPMGGSNLSRTYGLDRNQMGSLMTAMGARGIFGQISGESGGLAMMETATKGNLEALRKFNPDIQLGQIGVRDFRGATMKLTKSIEEAAGVAAALKDFFGSSAMDDLLRKAEALTGTQLNSHNGATMRSRIMQVTQMATAQGLNPGAVIDSQIALSQQLQTMFRSTAGEAASAAHYGFMTGMPTMNGLNQMSGVLGARGMYSTPVSDVYLRNMNAYGAMAIGQEMPGIRAAAHLLANRPGMPAAERARLEAALQATGSGDVPTQRNAHSALMRVFSETSGTTVAEYARMYGGKLELSPQDNERTSRLTLGMDQARLTAQLHNALRINDKAYSDAGLKDHRAALRSLFVDQMSRSGVAGVLSALGRPDGDLYEKDGVKGNRINDVTTPEFRNLLASAGLTGDQISSAVALLKETTGSVGREQLLNAVLTDAGLRQAGPYQTHMSSGDKVAAAQQRLSDILKSAGLGGNAPKSPSAFWSGITGSAVIGGREMMNYNAIQKDPKARMAMYGMKKNADGTLAFEDPALVFKENTAFFGGMGINSVADLISKSSDPATNAMFLDRLGDAGWQAAGQGDSLGIMSGETFKKNQARLTEERELQAFSSLTGIDVTKAALMTPDDRKAKAAKAVSEKGITDVHKHAQLIRARANASGWWGLNKINKFVRREASDEDNMAALVGAVQNIKTYGATDELKQQLLGELNDTATALSKAMSKGTPEEQITNKANFARISELIKEVDPASGDGAAQYSGRITMMGPNVFDFILNQGKGR